MRTARKRDNEQAIASFEKTRKSGSLPLNEKRTTHYGNVIRRYREKAGLDQGSVGRAIGYSTNTISNTHWHAIIFIIMRVYSVKLPLI